MWTETYQLTSQGTRHTMRSSDWGGAFIDIQSWSNRPPSPTSFTDLRQTYSRLRELTLPAASSEVRENTLSGRRALIEDATFDWRGTRYRRVTWIVPPFSRANATPSTEWVSVDVTARVADWQHSAPRLLRYVEALEWRQ
jgi:hypothetical protein